MISVTHIYFIMIVRNNEYMHIKVVKKAFYMDIFLLSYKALGI